MITRAFVLGILEPRTARALAVMLAAILSMNAITGVQRDNYRTQRRAEIRVGRREEHEATNGAAGA